MPHEAMSHFHPARPAQFRIRRFAYSSSLLILAVCGATVQTAAAQTPAAQGSLVAFNAGLEDLPDAPLPQSAAPQSKDSSPAASAEPVTIRETPLNIAKDQAAIWSSPAHIHGRDLKWLIPLGLVTTVAITADHQAMSSEVSHDAKFNHDNVVASDVFTGVLVAIPIGLMGKGQLFKDPHAREAGILGGEALVDSLVVEQGMKLIFWRERPLADGAKGKFFQRNAGVDSSFPSAHSALAWSSAAVLAGEYPAWWQQLGFYSIAAGVSATRVLGQQHFPSDVVVGSAAGWLIGHYVYRKHHKIRVESY